MKEAMEWLWEKLCEKDENGDLYIIWTHPDVVEMYHNGFVDTDKFSKEKWIEAFKGDPREGVHYKISKKSWLAKRPFRYNKKLTAPFDPLSIREGEWSPEDLRALLENKVFPLTTISDRQIDPMFKTAREMGRYVNGFYVVTKPFKIGLKSLIMNNPSPKFRREQDFAKAEQQLESKGKKSAKSTLTDQRKSGFVVGERPDRRVSGKLSDLLSGKKK
jgi:hypothetical protein